jgi:hypothetical protein
MIRQPSLDIIKLIKQIDWNLPPLKVVLCKLFLLISHLIDGVFFSFKVPAELGVGMSLCLFHVLHYGFRKKMLLVNTPTGNSNSCCCFFREDFYRFISSGGSS